MIIVKDLREFQRSARAFDRLGRDQLPFAIAGAINSALFTARGEIVGAVWDRAFDVHNRRFAGVSMRIHKANRRHLEGELFDRLGRGNLGAHALGGFDRPQSSSRLAVPQGEIKSKRTSRGVPKRLRPRSLRPKKTLRITDKGIFRAEGGKITPLYFFATRARLKRRFDFYKVFARVVIREIPREFPRLFAKAVRTSMRGGRSSGGGSSKGTSGFAAGKFKPLGRRASTRGFGRVRASPLRGTNSPVAGG